MVGGKKQIVIRTLGNNKMLFHLAVGYHFYTTPPWRAPLLRGGELGECGGLSLLYHPALAGTPLEEGSWGSAVGGGSYSQLPSFKGGVPR